MLISRISCMESRFMEHPRERRRLLLSMLGITIVNSYIVLALNVEVDAIANERERGWSIF